MDGNGAGATVVLGLEDPRAADPRLTGAKAAALARATAAGLPVLPGFVVGVNAYGPQRREPVLHNGVRPHWDRLSAGGRRPLVVRSSSAVEDGTTTSMAGVFTSVLDVRGEDGFNAAVDEVLASANVVPMAGGPGAGAPMGVLVQPFLVAARGGVLFGADPVTGRRDRLVLAAVDGGPDKLVQGIDGGARYVLTRSGRIVEDDGGAGPVVTRSERRALARLARDVERLFGGPQDIEWAVDDDGRLWLLQSRPITTLVAQARAKGPRLGPGPVAETFPDPLAPLEEDLWVEPLREGLRHALALSGAASSRKVANSPVVVSVEGRVAADLDLLGPVPVTGFWRRLDPRPPMRRLRAAWRVGRLRAALPALGADLVTAVDDDLAQVPRLTELSDADLVALLRRARSGLVALHGHEALAGMLVDEGAGAVTGVAAALRALAEARAAGLDDAAAVARHPVVLALVAPRIGLGPDLPPLASAPPPLPTDVDRAAVIREALRLRARWLQELTARAAWELAGRLVRAGVLEDRATVRSLHLSELEAAVRGEVEVAAGLTRPAPGATSSPPLPASFRLAADGTVVPERARRRAGTGGTGAGGGRGRGAVHQGDGPIPPGAVLVVRTLDPALAPVLSGLGGLVAETGSVLSHLAILAREMGVPTVVGVERATERFLPGAVVAVDGDTGDVQVEGVQQEVVA